MYFVTLRSETNSSFSFCLRKGHIVNHLSQHKCPGRVDLTLTDDESNQAGPDILVTSAYSSKVSDVILGVSILFNNGIQPAFSVCGDSASTTSIFNPAHAPDADAATEYRQADSYPVWTDASFESSEIEDSWFDRLRQFPQT